MLKENRVAAKDLEDYEEFLSPRLKIALSSSKRLLSGLRVVHVNSTPEGGGVAEILKSLVPLEQSLGLDAHWFSLTADRQLFAITKKLHNSLQGSSDTLSAAEQQYYQNYGRRLVPEIARLDPDILVLHDPQVLSAAGFLKNVATISRIHIDLSTPNLEALKMIRPHLARCAAVIFSSRQFVPPELRGPAIYISQPAIDPYSGKNMPMSKQAAERICRLVGLDPHKPLLVQVSRFDPWKDPIGVIVAYRLVKQKFPGAQLALLGITQAQDDPEAQDVLRQVKDAIRPGERIFLFSHPRQTKGIPLDQFVNAVQTAATVVLQKSIREGFGLVVTEAMWKFQPVVGGKVGGLLEQIQDGRNGFLVENPREAAARALLLLTDHVLKKTMGLRAHQTVRDKFLITRLLVDEIAIMNETIRVRQEAYSPESQRASRKIF